MIARRLEGAKSFVNTVVWNPDGTRVAAGGEDKVVRIWNAATGETIREFLRAGCRRDARVQ